MSDTFTSEYFRKEACKLRELWGTQTFWADTEKGEKSRDAAIKAFGFVYLNIEGAVKESDVSIFEATMLEYTKRESLLLQYGKLPNKLNGVY